MSASWGFACVIKGPEKTILFDTGGDSAVLLNNMQQLGIDPKAIDVVVLSHIHGDHVGGFHLAAMSKPKLEEIITNFRKLGVERVGPCHCSGDLARRMFKQEYGNGYMNVGFGRRIDLP
ncbi:MAG: MBL fold metallo-hydrolase [Desulfobacterales bacterium]